MVSMVSMVLVSILAMLIAGSGPLSEKNRLRTTSSVGREILSRRSASPTPR